MKRKGTEVVAYATDRGLKRAFEEQPGVKRTSNLMAPIVALEGQQGDIFGIAFHPEGKYLASTGFDRQIFLWNVYGECENISTLSGHTGAIMDISFSTDGNTIFTCATDNTVAMWDIISGQRIKKLKGHSGFVNSCQPTRRGQLLIVSGSDDCSVRVWDPRKKGKATSLVNPYQVLTVSFNDTAEQVFSSGIDNEIKIWDLRTNAVATKLRGHTDTVTGMALSSDGSYLLTNSMDNTLRIWDVRPYAPPERCVKILSGHQHNFEKNLLRCSWSPDGSKVSAGSGDRFVYVWDTTTRRILYKLPGHNGSVNDVQFHPNEPIIASGSSDKTIYLGELED
ncbi:U5 small nuclear ribonucleoprotein 40 kDa protein-like [Cimex lectularius]|uniref:U5 small nuclear ribonucleoprotein 40 kDa protein n=1 Tax=Cimex lectularius TaxID=79782 RepID=A0A8I6RYM8_CIMLE|nr:U5 small nuclear ribonucleoprotein 40 kDa protein-like [Cimex lectularius]